MPGLKDATVGWAQDLDCDLYDDFEQLKLDRANEQKRHKEAIEQLEKDSSDLSSEFTESSSRSKRLKYR